MLEGVLIGYEDRSQRSVRRGPEFRADQRVAS